MFKIIKKNLIFILLVTISFTNAYSNEELIDHLKKGNKIIFIRHALAPGTGDPDNFDINDCSTQRNLNDEGVKQSKKIGSFFYKNKISINQVLTSEWCRCVDTAKYAFKDFKKFGALNSFFSENFKKNKEKQMEDLNNFLRNWNDEGNLVLITHYVVILETINESVSSGEIVILDKNLNFIGRVNDY